MQEIIKLDNVCKRYQMGDSVVEAVCHINLEINKGDFLAIVGPSGSGKSTMMNLVGALDLASEGNIYLDRQNIEHLEENELARIRGKKIGFVFQTFNLIPTLTALENVMLPMMFQDYTREERRERAEELLKEIGTMKAVGAKNSDILLIFLFESGLLGLVGGAIGILLGIAIGKSVELVARSYLGTDYLRASFCLPLIIGALLFSFIVGSLSGILPAYQASRLKPADALRYE